MGFDQIADYIIATSHRVKHRTAQPEILAAEIVKYDIYNQIIPDAKNAVRKAIEYASENDLVLIIGSVFLIGEVRELWYSIPD